MQASFSQNHLKVAFTIQPMKVCRILLVLVICLVLVSFIGRSSEQIFGFENDFLQELVRQFDVSREKNIPTWYSSMALIGSSLLLGFIAFAKKTAKAPYAGHWSALSIIFVYLSIDEAAVIHERLNQPLRQMLGIGDVVLDSWVLFGAVFVTIGFLVYVKFLIHLPKKTRCLFLGAGAIFVGGALGVESVNTYFKRLYGDETLIFATLTSVEEFFEMAGIIVFIYALLSYIKSNFEEISILSRP